MTEGNASHGSPRKTFKNAFAPHVKNENLSVHDVITGLRMTLLDAQDLPPEVQDAVAVELSRQSARKDRADNFHEDPPT